jgi:hypothetical protein
MIIQILETKRPPTILAGGRLINDEGFRCQFRDGLFDAEE